jgi:hypothetical protein
MCERKEIVDGYRTHWKVDELTNSQKELVTNSGAGSVHITS